MKAVVFKGNDRIGVEEVPKPVPGVGEAVIRITATTICGTDVHIARGEYAAFDLFSHQRDGVLKVALCPQRESMGARARLLARGADREG